MANGCIEWRGGLYANGYGRVTLPNRKHGYAHRIAWEVANGEVIPEGLFVLHACDNPPCVNPDHLSVGTQAENVRQAIQRSRFRTASKLSTDDVRELRRRYAAEESQRELGREFGVDQSTVSQIITGRRRGNVT